MDWAYQAARHEEREQIYRLNLELARQQRARYESGSRPNSLRAPLPTSNETSGASQTTLIGALVTCFFIFFVFPLVFLAVLFLLGARKDQPGTPQLPAPCTAQAATTKLPHASHQQGSNRHLRGSHRPSPH